MLIERSLVYFFSPFFPRLLIQNAMKRMSASPVPHSFILRAICHDSDLTDQRGLAFAIHLSDEGLMLLFHAIDDYHQ